MNKGDRQILRLLASQWMEIANNPVMAERKRQWTALKDLRAERPMVLFETWTLENYVTDAELRVRIQPFGEFTTGHFFRVDESQEKTRLYDSGSAKPVHGFCTNPLDLMK